MRPLASSSEAWIQSAVFEMIEHDSLGSEQKGTWRYFNDKPVISLRSQKKGTGLSVMGLTLLRASVTQFRRRGSNVPKDANCRTDSGSEPRRVP
ncbi:hypothetical protein SKAU_G00429820 [Synaphobranchus kaupii]|uniref:Uncharacterized protein n=1 Tax=Synaphobranchus kaupii TaxID=118154 RepID=A0A9Q1E4S9_SYNKA|nr:hypothetical protein SKAU_G00429820 [Synaphobranchus kaupii]